MKHVKRISSPAAAAGQVLTPAIILANFPDSVQSLVLLIIKLAKGGHLTT
jgi:hypothetical protein